MASKQKQVFNKVPNEITTHFKNKNGDSIIVYINWEIKEKDEQKHSKMILKVRTNRFLKRENEKWKRIVDFKETLSNEFYIAIDSPMDHEIFVKTKLDNVSSEELRNIFGVDIYFIWKKFIDMHCSWEEEDISEDETNEEEDIPPEYID